MAVRGPTHFHDKTAALFLLVGFAGLIAMAAMLYHSYQTSTLSSLPAASVQPGMPLASFEASIMPGKSSRYQVTNPGYTPLRVQHVFVDRDGRVLYSFFDTVAPMSSEPYRMSALPLPPDFDGQVRIYASQAVRVQNLNDEPSH